MAACNNPVNLDNLDRSGMKSEHAKANLEFVERLARAPRGTVINRITDDLEGEGNGYYDLFAFPSQYQGGVIPAPVLARLLGAVGANTGTAVQEFLGGWFVVGTISRSWEWNSLPSRPDPRKEVYREGDQRALEVAIGETKEGRRVLVTVTDPCCHTVGDSGTGVWLTSSQAVGLAKAILQRRPTSVGSNDGKASASVMLRRDGEVWLGTSTTHTGRSYEVKLPQYMVVGVHNALLEVAHKLA